MNITVDVWQLLSFFGGILSFLIITAFGLVKWLLSQIKQGIDSRFDAHDKLQRDAQTQIDKRFCSLGTALEKNNSDSLRIERELMTLKADLPNLYVRREDFALSHSEIKVRIDGLSLKIDNVLLRSTNNHD